MTVNQSETVLTLRDGSNWNISLRGRPSTSVAVMTAENSSSRGLSSSV